MKVVVIGAPVDAGAGQRGAVMGPVALRLAGLVDGLRALGLDVEDWGDLAVPVPVAVELPEARAHNLGQVAAWARLLAERAQAAMRHGAVPVFLGGDHSLSMGSVTGVARHARAVGRPLVVLWLDAHADFNTPDTTPSGNMHGMSAALLCGEAGLEAVFGDGGDGSGAPCPIAPQDLHLFGIRSVDRAERQALRSRGIDVVDMRVIDEFGVAVPLRRVLDKAAATGAMLHVSLDVDFLDPSLAPGVGTTVPGGATYREAHLVMEMLHDSGLVTSVDVVELNPFLDVRGRSALLLADLVGSLFGRRITERETEPGVA
jgi:arginase